MVSTKIRRLQRMHDNSLDENLSLSADLLAEEEKKKRFIKVAWILAQLFFFGAGLTILVIIVLCSLEDAGYIFLPSIHAISRDYYFLGHIMLSIASVSLLSFPVNLILAIVERFVPVKVENSRGSSQEEKLKCLKRNLQSLHSMYKSNYLPDTAEAGNGFSCVVFTTVCGLTLSVALILELVRGGFTMSTVGTIIGDVIFIGIVLAFFCGICMGYFYICNSFICIIYSHIPYGGTYVQKHVGRLLSTYAEYEEYICVSAMTPSERHSYIQKKQQAEKEERERQAERIRSAQWEAQWEKDHKTPVVVDLDRVAAQAQAIYAASRGEYHLTTEDHEILDSIKSMRDTYGDDWTKDM